MVQVMKRPNWTKLLSTTCLSPLVISISISAADAQAVSGTNGTLSFGADSAFGSNYANTSASFTFPLGNQFGVQLDGRNVFGNSAQESQLSAHLFARESNLGLLGLYGSAETHGITGQQNTWRAGIEGELYRDNLTLSAVVGKTFGGTQGMFTQARVSYYPSDDLKIVLGYADDALTYGSLGFEARDPLSGVSWFGEGRFGLGPNSNEAAGISVGMRYSFGGNQENTLIEHDRNEVAPLWVHIAAKAEVPTSVAPTVGPTVSPTVSPTVNPYPTISPTVGPTLSPTGNPYGSTNPPPSSTSGPTPPGYN